MAATTIDSTFETNKVLRNTYWLLSGTLLNTAISAWVAVLMNIEPINIWVQLIVAIGLLFLTMATAESSLGLVCVLLFTGFEGLTLGPVLHQVTEQFVNGPELIAYAFGLTALVFIALSSYVTITKKDFGFLGGTLFVALIGLIVVSIAGIIFHIPGLQLMVSFAAVVIFSGFILYDTSEIINGGETNYIRATVQLYLDILNMFLNILQILLSLSGKD